MITKQHQFSSRILGKSRDEYRLHMCGTCHSLGDHYGFVSRLLTNHEVILLNMLVNAQQEKIPEIVLRRCPLNPFIHVPTNQDTASQLSSAVAIEMTHASLEDDVIDRNSILARLGVKLLAKSRIKASQSLAELGMDTSSFKELTRIQQVVESDTEAPWGPTAQLSAELFASTARLANQVENTSSLANIGYCYGMYLYLMDAFRDYPTDMKEGQFNPLSSYALQEQNYWVLPLDALRFLNDTFLNILNTIQLELSQLKLNRYTESLSQTICDPVSSAQNAFQKQLETNKGLLFSGSKPEKLVAATASSSALLLAYTFVNVNVVDSDWATQFVVLAQSDSLPEPLIGCVACCGLYMACSNLCRSDDRYVVVRKAGPCD